MAIAAVKLFHQRLVGIHDRGKIIRVHRSWWEDRRERNLALASASNRLTGAVMKEIVDQRNQVLQQLQGA